MGVSYCQVCGKAFVHGGAASGGVICETCRQTKVLKGLEKVLEDRNQIERGNYHNGESELKELIEGIKNQNEEDRRERERKQEEEDREKAAQEWAAYLQRLDSIPESEIQSFYEETADKFERDYLRPRYRNHVSAEDYLDLLKDEDKYIAKKQILNYIASHSKEDALDYVLNVNNLWYKEIVEKEHLLDNLVSMSPELQALYDKQENSLQRQKYLRTTITFNRFKRMTSVERQIYFRELVQKKNKKFFGDKEEIKQLISLLEPIYIEDLTSEEKKAYLEEKEKREIPERELSALRQQLNQKQEENKQLIEESNEINKRKDDRIPLLENGKNSKMGCGCLYLICITIFSAVFGLGSENLSDSMSNVVMVAFIGINIPFFIAYKRIGKRVKLAKKEEKQDFIKQKNISERTQVLKKEMLDIEEKIKKISLQLRIGG